jgi:hypothetical protein
VAAHQVMSDRFRHNSRVCNFVSHKAQELQALLQGQCGAESGEELLSTLVRLSTERVLQEALEDEQARALGRGRYERRESALG